jgi:hypothetical protein
VLLLNVLYRIGVQGDREEEARRYFDEHGRWPDKQPAIRSSSTARSREFYPVVGLSTG